LFLAQESLQVVQVREGQEPCCPVEVEGWEHSGLVVAHRAGDSVVGVGLDRRRFGDNYADAVLVRLDPR